MRKKKEKYVDDGHTIYNMDVDGLPNRRIPINKDNIGMTRKEKRALMRSAMAHYIPILLIILACFSIAMLLIYFWLK